MDTTAPRTLKRSDIAALWRDIHAAGTARAGRTDWTTGHGIWMVRSRVLAGNVPNRKLEPLPTFDRQTSRKLTEYIDKFTRDARPLCRSVGTRTWYHHTEPVVVLHNASTWMADPDAAFDRSSIRVAFHRERFDAMSKLINEHTEAAWSIRCDPWQRIASWWTIGAKPYPLAIMAGYHGGDLLLDGEVAS